MVTYLCFSCSGKRRIRRRRRKCVASTGRRGKPETKGATRKKTVLPVSALPSAHLYPLRTLPNNLPQSLKLLKKHGVLQILFFCIFCVPYTKKREYNTRVLVTLANDVTTSHKKTANDLRHTCTQRHSNKQNKCTHTQVDRLSVHALG